MQVVLLRRKVEGLQPSSYFRGGYRGRRWRLPPAMMCEAFGL